MGAATKRIGKVTLTVNDLSKVSEYYERVVGLHLVARDGETARLGGGGVTLLELREDKAARRASAREAGLFHTAFLLPSRADLGAWLRRAVEGQVRLQGAADHLVSEAIYLADPEGNGIEIYRDRLRDEWTVNNGMVEMATEALDAEGIMASAEKPWDSVPDGTVVGHVHLQAGALAPAEGFYNGVLGFPVTCRFPGAVFYGDGGYHHHLATNIWNSRGAEVRSYPATGLASVEILAPGAVGRTVTDPWGTEIVVTGA
jgi:catechol 2,3-dioxygenase